MYLPTLIDGSSDGFVGSSINTLPSAKAGTSYHLPLTPKNSCGVGTFEYEVPSLCIIDVTPNTFFSGKKNSKNGRTSFGVITLLNTFVIPFTTVSLFVMV